MSAQRIALPGGGDPSAAARAAALLREGALVVVPTESSYAIAADPAVAAARTRLAALPLATPAVLHVLDPDRAAQRAGLTPRAERLRRRFWPGPLAILRGAGEPGAVRVPAHQALRQILAGFPEGLWLRDLENGDGQPLAPGNLPASVTGAAALLLDAGGTRLRAPTTVVRDHAERLEVVREGILSAEEILHAAARHVLFVCTGNTCRSPLAEALARRAVARALGVSDDQIEAHGIGFTSAGAGTLPGMPASEGSVLAAREAGVDLSRHRTRSLDRGLAGSAQQILCMGRSHRARVLELDPTLAERTELLDPAGREVSDPFGGSLQEYRDVREQIAAAIAARLPAFLALAAS
ncbi:MAG: Sua5/YciO/YrdC/YwlC family protein [Planctomycetes bacterium]|nr:Sua5/YciO/YrdC/YwlC family protein [Planctomycetota bacterium]